MRTAVLVLTTVIALIALPATALAGGREFNWIPAAKVDVGNPESEALVDYWSNTPDKIHAGLNFAGGKRLETWGRSVTAERYSLGLISFGRPTWGTLVIRRLWDTRQGPATIQVVVDPQVKENNPGLDLPEWNIPKIEGPPRWVYVYYVVPREAMIIKQGETERLKWAATVSLAYDKPTPSYEQTFLVTRDWEVLGEKYYGGLEPAIKDMDEFVPAIAYQNGLAALGLGEYDTALQEFRKLVAKGSDSGFARLARRMIRLVSVKKIIDAQPARVAQTPAEFQQYYRLGLYAEANGFWEEALDQFTKAVQADPSDGEATYRLAEAMEFNRLPIAQWAPVMERAGDLFQRDDFNTVDMLVAIQMDRVLWREPDQYICNNFDKNSMDVLKRDWTYVRQAVWGSSRGMYNMNYTFRTYDANDPPWVFQAAWLFGPADSEVPIRGTYDYCTGMAGYGSSHCGGVDCGVSGSAQSQIGPGRGWEVFIHEWNHGFDWTAISGEIIPGYPVTHASGGCGKYPDVSMGCGHHSSMYYYINPAQYRRHEPSDPEIKGNHIKAWTIGGLTPFDMPGKFKDGELAAWIVSKGYLEQPIIDQWKKAWEDSRKPPAGGESLIKSEMASLAARAKRTWDETLFHSWTYSYRILDKVAAPNEERFHATPGSLRGKKYESPNDFVDLMKVFPDAAPKTVAYAETYVWSPKDQEVRMWLGHNDAITVWVNGRKVHKGRYPAIAKWEDENRTDMVADFAWLKKGWNHVLCKVERFSGGWGFSVGLVNYDNTPVEGLKYQAAKPGAAIARYTPPEVGKRYNWDEVKDDFIELLPHLTDEDVKTITGLKNFRKEPAALLFHAEPVKGSRVIPEPNKDDKQLNNYLNWDWEAVAAVRYERDGRYRDLVFIRPEYYEEYVRLLPGDAANNVVGVVWIESPDGSLATYRSVIAIDTRIEGEYPQDEEEILTLPGE